MNIAQSRAEWLAARQKGIGGSDAGAILGLNRWRSPVDVWLDKTGRSAAQEENAAMYWGNKLEDIVVREYVVRTGLEVRRHNFMPRVGVLLGSVDRLVCEPGTVPAVKGEVRAKRLLEAKTASSKADWEDGGAPAHYVAQVMHYMGLLPSVEVAAIACLFLTYDREYRIVEIQRDQAIIDAMQAQLTEWWEEFVARDVPPTPESESDCKKLWARHQPGKTATASDDVSQALSKLKEIQTLEKTIEAEKSMARDQVLAAIGEAEILVDSLGTPLATWKANKDSQRIDWEKVALELNPTVALIERYTKTVAGSRVFRIK